MCRQGSFVNGVSVRKVGGIYLLRRLPWLRISCVVSDYPVLTGFFFLAAFPGLIPEAGATDWTARPYASLGYRYNDNVHLSITDAQSASAITSVVGIGLEAAKKRWSAALNGKYSDINYSPDDSLDRENTSLGLKTEYKTERGALGITGSSVNDSTLVFDSAGVDTGLTEEQRERVSNNGGVYWKRRASERLSVDIGYDLSDVSYDHVGSAEDLFDFENNTTRFNISYAASEKSHIVVRFGYTDFLSDRINAPAPQPGVPVWNSRDSTTQGYQVGYSYRFSDNTSGTLFVGASRTSFTNFFDGCITPIDCTTVVKFENTGTDNNPLYSLELTKKHTTGNIGLAASRTIEPSSSGAEVISDSVSVNASKSLSKKLRTTLSVSHLVAKTIGEDLNNNDRRLIVVKPGLDWRQRGDSYGWSGVLNYQYAEVKRESEQIEAAANSANLIIKYYWPKK